MFKDDILIKMDYTQWNDVNCGNTNKRNMWPSQLNRNLSNCKLARKKDFRTLTGFEPVASAFALQCFTSWAMKTYTLEAGQFIEFINPWKESFFRATSQLLKLRFNCDGHIFISFVFPRFTSFHSHLIWSQYNEAYLYFVFSHRIWVWNTCVLSV